MILSELLCSTSLHRQQLKLNVALIAFSRRSWRSTGPCHLSLISIPLLSYAEALRTTASIWPNANNESCNMISVIYDNTGKRQYENTGKHRYEDTGKRQYEHSMAGKGRETALRALTNGGATNHLMMSTLLIAFLIIPRFSANTFLKAVAKGIQKHYGRRS